DQYLSPIPDRRAPSCAFLEQVPSQCNVKTQPLKYPNRYGVRCPHAIPPCSSGRPFHRLINLRFVSRTSRSPVEVAWKYRFALPPLSGVASPSSERTKPLV